MTVLSLLYAFAVTGWTMLRFTPAATWRPFEFADLLGWLWFTPLVLLLPLSVLTRRRHAIAFLMVPVVFFAVEYGPMFTPGSAPPPGASRLRVVTANVLFTNRDIDGLVEMFERLDADVVALHELSTPVAEALVRRMGDRYPHRIMHPKAHALGMGLMSRVRLTETFAPRLGRDECSCHQATAAVGGQQVTIVNAHPLPPGHTPLSFDPERQAATIDRLLDVVDDVEGPLVVMGDFNVSDRHRYYRDFRRRLGDAHRDAGSGFGFTWRAPSPFLRIDYVMRSDHWGTGESYAGTIPGSDHRYVYADLVLL